MHVPGKVFFFGCLTLAIAEAQPSVDSTRSHETQWAGRSRNSNGIILLVPGDENNVDAPMSFWAAREKKDPFELPFWAARGKKSGNVENMEIPFWAARGKRDKNQYLSLKIDGKGTEARDDESGLEDNTPNGYMYN